MVARRGRIIAGHVHQFDGRGTLRHADGGIALNVVAGVHQQDVGALGLKGILDGRHLGVAANGTMHIVGVQDDDGAIHGPLGLLRAGGDSQREHHGHSQQQGQEFLLHASITSLFFTAETDCGFGLIIPYPEKIDSPKLKYPRKIFTLHFVNFRRLGYLVIRGPVCYTDTIK